MKRSILFIIAISLIGSNAFAQLLPGYGLSGPYSSGSTVSPQGIAVYGTSSGFQNIYDPYGTIAAASKFGPPPGYAVVHR